MKFGVFCCKLFRHQYYTTMLNITIFWSALHTLSIWECMYQKSYIFHRIKGIMLRDEFTCFIAQHITSRALNWQWATDMRCTTKVKYKSLECLRQHKVQLDANLIARNFDSERFSSIRQCGFYLMESCN